MAVVNYAYSCSSAPVSKKLILNWSHLGLPICSYLKLFKNIILTAFTFLIDSSTKKIPQIPKLSKIG